MEKYLVHFLCRMRLEPLLSCLAALAAVVLQRLDHSLGKDMPFTCLFRATPEASHWARTVTSACA